jgi:hypothetical protein
VLRAAAWAFVFNFAQTPQRRRRKLTVWEARNLDDMVFIFVIAIAVLSVSLGFLLNGAWSAVFTIGDVPEPPDNPRDLDDPEQRREFERRYPPTKRL